MFIQRFRQGDRVDYVYKGLRGGSGPGGDHGALQMSQQKATQGQQIVLPGGQTAHLPGTQAQNAFQKAIEEKEGTRRRGYIDAVCEPDEEEGDIRVYLYDKEEYVWAHPSELEQLDAISQLGDVVGPNGRSLHDSLEPDDTKDYCKDCEVEIKGEVQRMGFSKRCLPCHNKKLGIK
jgi:hypothetical protein